MHFLAMLNLHGLTLFIWVVSVLTLSIGDEIKADGPTPVTFNNLSGSDHHTSLSTVQPTPTSLNLPKIPNKNATTSSFMGEGGPISIASTIEYKSSTISHLGELPTDVNIHDKLSKEDTAQNVVKKTTTVSKIVPRKGANEMPDVTKASTKVISLNNTKTIVESSTTASGIHNVEESVNAGFNKSKSNSTGKHLQDTLNTIKNDSLRNPSMFQKNISSTTVMASTMKEHKAKPTVTIAGPNSDKRGFVSSVRSHLGMPKKIDYVLPVIISLIALPLLGAIIFMVYKQGRDCWDKRHYRRMDFLIDGMYND